jgi:hypothetical protein
LLQRLRVKTGNCSYTGNLVMARSSLDGSRVR